MQILNLSHYLPLVVYPYAFLKPEVLFCTVRLFFFVCFVLFCFWLCLVGSFPLTRNHAQRCLLQWKLGILTTGLPDNSLKPEVLRELENKTKKSTVLFIYLNWWIGSLLKISVCSWGGYFHGKNRFLWNICFSEHDSFRYLFSIFHRFHHAFILHRKMENKAKQILNSSVFSPSEAVLS